MAEIIPRLEGGRAQVASVPGAVLPNVSMPSARPEVAFEAASRYQGALSSTISQLSGQLFGISEVIGQKAGLQFAAENGLTEEQLKAIAKGDTSSISTGFGSDFNVFSAAVKKYRSMEVSSYAEIEARNELLSLHARAEAGEDISATDIQAKVASILKGPSESLSQIDPDASFKYRATVARMGGDIIKDVARMDAKKRIAANSIKEGINYNNQIREVELFLGGDMPINKATGAPFEPRQIIDSLSEDLLNKALIYTGPDGVVKRQSALNKDIDQAVVNSLTKRVLEDKAFANPNTKAALRGNDQVAIGQILGASGLAVWNYSSEDAKAKVRQSLTLAENDAYNAGEREQKRIKDETDKYADKKLIEYWSTENPEIRRSIAIDLAQRHALSHDEIGKMLDPKQQDGDEYVFGDLLHQVKASQLNDRASIRSVARKSGMSGKQYTRLIEAFDERLLNKEEGDASKVINAAAGVPDVVTVRGQDDEHKFAKRNILMGRYIAAKEQALKEGKTYSPRELALSIANGYAGSDAKDAQKTDARQKIKSAVDQINTDKKQSISIDENTNLDELEKAGFIDKNTKIYLRKQQEIIRRISQ
jgi:predicted transcriptional regulator